MPRRFGHPYQFIETYIDEKISTAIPAPPLIGEIRVWPSESPPAGFLLCNGRAVSRTTYAALFAVIGTSFGSGDGSTTFNLPTRASLSTWILG